MICFYYSDNLELLAGAPVIEELRAMKVPVIATTDLSTPAKVGVHLHHSNALYDFENHRWMESAAGFSVGMLHDLFQDGGEGGKYFSNDSWRPFDLGLIPGPRWEAITFHSELLSIPGPKLGFQVVGWPKSDKMTRSASSKPNKSLKPRILVAASWSGMLQLGDILEYINLEEYSIVVKFPRTDVSGFRNSPWFGILQAQSQEIEDVLALATAFRGIEFADPEGDIFELIASVDLVISNGSNVSYEALILGKPSLQVLDWPHPDGDFGENTKFVFSEFPGIANTSARRLNSAIKTALASNTLQNAAAQGKSWLVADETLGRSSAITANLLLQILNGAFPAPQNSAVANEGFNRPGFYSSRKAAWQAQFSLESSVEVRTEIRPDN